MKTRIITIEWVGENNVEYEGGNSYSTEWLPSEPYIGKSYLLTTDDTETRILAIEDI